MAGAAGGKGVPSTPDYMGAANLMGQQSLYNTQYQTYANRPNITTPEGSITWTPPADNAATEVPASSTASPANSAVGGRMWARPGTSAPSPGVDAAAPPQPGQWSANIQLSPERQAALEAQQRLGAARSGLGETLFGRAQTELGNPADWGGLPGSPDANAARQQAVQAGYQQATSMLDPQWNQRADALRSQLLNEGLRPGMQQYDQRMAEFERGRTSAYDTAMRSAIMGGEQAAQGEFGRGLAGRQQGIAEMLQRRGSTLNEINALLGGQQVGMPQFPGFAQAGMAATPDYLGALGQQYQGNLNSYNAQQAQLQNLQQGGLSALAFML